MERLTVNGGKALYGCTSVPTSKNAILPIVAASVMTDGESIIKSCPLLTDVYTSADIINSIGGRAVLHNGDFCVSYCESDCCTINEELCKKMRSSVLYAAPILYRKGKVTLCYPGGCNLGERKIDIHLAGLQLMGANIECEKDKITITAPHRLKGIQFRLHTASVGATQTLMMAASTAEGITILRNCAREPEVVDLARFLKCAGAKITGAGRGEIIIQGVQFLNSVEYTPIADRIFAATILSAVNACGGMVFMKNYPTEYMDVFEKLLKDTGLKIVHLSKGALVVKCYDKAVNIKAHTGCYPVFSTDMGPLLSSALVNNNGTLTLNEGVFENRFAYASEFCKLGMSCRINKNEYFQTIGETVHAADLKASDLRAGAALVVAALAKRGKYTIEGLEYIDRGYERIENTFSALGGYIRRETFEG